MLYSFGFTRSFAILFFAFYSDSDYLNTNIREFQWNTHPDPLGVAAVQHLQQGFVAPQCDWVLRGTVRGLLHKPLRGALPHVPSRRPYSRRGLLSSRNGCQIWGVWAGKILCCIGVTPTILNKQLVKRYDFRKLNNASEFQCYYHGYTRAKYSERFWNETVHYYEIFTAKYWIYLCCRGRYKTYFITL